jgi:hypothetical protein
MAASVEAVAPPSPPAAIVATEEADGGDAEQAKTLISTLNLLSCNLPLPRRATRRIVHLPRR